ncbi:hypothetical protein [Roseovarius sp. 217]|uniref:hypothetical protein n=1 Tax=Roseovarius sp. (strain 217) TaxID=314264 RepID=UPI0020C7AF31|nr:hypothetical protein [Roseovarius sp. 217]
MKVVSIRHNARTTPRSAVRDWGAGMGCGTGHEQPSHVPFPFTRWPDRVLLSVTRHAGAASATRHPEINALTRVSRIFAALVLASFAAGCSTPRESCIASVTRDYRALESLMVETQQNIIRGYAVHSQSVPYTVQGICHWSDPYTYRTLPYPCPSTQYRTQTTPVAIDVSHEKEKLAQYKRLLPDYAARAANGVKQCNAQFPENS